MFLNGKLIGFHKAILPYYKKIYKLLKLNSFIILQHLYLEYQNK